MQTKTHDQAPSVGELRQTVGELLARARANEIASGYDVHIGLAALSAAGQRIRTDDDFVSAAEFAECVLDRWIRLFQEQSRNPVAQGEYSSGASTLGSLIRRAINTFQELGVPGMEGKDAVFDRVVDSTQPDESQGLPT